MKATKKCKGCGHVLPKSFFGLDPNRCYLCDDDCTMLIPMKIKVSVN